MIRIMTDRQIREYGEKIADETARKCYQKSQIQDLFNPLHSINFHEKKYEQMLKTADRIQCVNRLIIEDLPSSFTSNEIESMLYYYGAICCFLYRNVLTFAPFATGGKLTTKGNLEYVQPVTLNGVALGNKRKCYGADANYDYDSSCCIIIQDYTGAVNADKIIPRSAINSSTTINDEVRTYKQLVYNIVMNIKKLIVHCENEEQVKVMMKQASQLLDPTQPIVALKDINLNGQFGCTDFVDKVDIDGLSRAIDFYNKIRRQFNGIPSPDVFEKKERMISDELEDVGKSGNLILYDAYINRKIAFDNINKCFGTNIKVRINDELGGETNGQLHGDMEIQRYSRDSG